MPSLHCVGFLAHAIKIEDFSSIESFKYTSLCPTFKAPATVTLHKIHLNKIPKERNLTVTKLKQVLVCNIVFMTFFLRCFTYRMITESYVTDRYYLISA